MKRLQGRNEMDFEKKKILTLTLSQAENEISLAKNEIVMISHQARNEIVMKKPWQRMK
jgi:hypothetical protein